MKHAEASGGPFDSARSCCHRGAMMNLRLQISAIRPYSLLDKGWVVSDTNLGVPDAHIADTIGLAHS